MNEERERFVPLSIREGKREPFKPVEGIPGFLWPSIKYWLDGYLQPSGYWQTKRIHALGRALQFVVPARTDWDFLEALDLECKVNEEFCLDVVDALLFLGHDPDTLDQYLWDVGHVYTVHTDRKRLVKRIDDTVWASYEQAVKPGDQAARLLESAWAKQYSRDQDPNGAADDATAAVEALLRPVVAPNDEKATFGRMISAIEDAPDKWECAIPDRNWKGQTLTGTDTFLNALKTVLYRPNRHGGGTRDGYTVEQSSTVVLQAVTIVGWLRQNAFRRVMNTH